MPFVCQKAAWPAWAERHPNQPAHTGSYPVTLSRVVVSERAGQGTTPAKPQFEPLHQRMTTPRNRKGNSAAAVERTSKRYSAAESAKRHPPEVLNITRRLLFRRLAARRAPPRIVARWTLSVARDRLGLRRIEPPVEPPNHQRYFSQCIRGCAAPSSPTLLEKPVSARR